ncbi:MAG: GNAT family N-acetyltransferase [Thermoplasmata archaeon]
MQIEKYNEKWSEAFRRFWCTVAHCDFSAIFSSQDYLPEYHLLGIIDGNVVCTAFLMKFEGYYMVLAGRKEEGILLPLLKNFMKNIENSSINEVAIKVKPNDMELKCVLLKCNFQISSTHYKMKCQIYEQNSIPDGIKICAENELENAQKLFLESFGEKERRNIVAYFEREQKEMVVLESYACGKLCGALILMRFPQDCTRAYIPLIAVSENFRSQGHGRKLLRGAKGWACMNGVKEIFLAVETSNKNAVELYKKEGFEICEEMEIFVWKGS